MELGTWKEFRRGLRPADQAIFDRLTQYARQHADAGSLAARPLLTEVIFFAIAIEQQKAIERLHEALEQLNAKIGALERQMIPDECKKNG
jgi:hypothetical protein